MTKPEFRFTDPTVNEFKDWWIKNGAPIRPPFKDAVFFTEVAQALVLYRQGIFQVELYMVKPNTSAPSHTHPGVDSCLMYLTGNLEFGDENGKFENLQGMQHAKADGSHFLLGQNRSLGAISHSLRCGKEGGAFLSFEKWNNGNPTSVAENWEGPPVGKEHAKIKISRMEICKDKKS